jgi:mono/diheme cytochrome c family protein
MKHPRENRGRAALIVASLAGLACQAPAPPVAEDTAPAEPHLVGPDDLATGRYLAIVTGCNDCHTDGYLLTEGQVPEDQWLLGSPLGWRGPWGTTYARNLRLTVQTMTEDAWVETLKTRKALPPMPWMNVSQMAESDMRLLYGYVESLGPGGERMPDTVPPGVEPTTPYLSLEPTMPGAG